MRLLPLVAAASLLLVAAPVVSASHTYWPCMQIWLTPPPGWSQVCSTLDWTAHNPFTPLANCLLDPLSVSVIGVEYDVKQALACV